MALSPISAKASLDPSGFTAGVIEIKKRLSELNAAYETNKAEMKQLGTEMNKLEREKRKLTEQMKNGGTDEQKKKLAELNDKIAQVATQLGVMRTKEAELRSELKETTKELESNRTKAQELEGAFSQLGQLFVGLGIAEACHQLADAFGECVRAAADFEATMSTVEALSGATASQMQELTDKAKELGATTKFTATESAQAMTYMGMAGWDATQMLNGMDGVLDLAAASGTDLAMTADIITDALTAFGLKAEDTTHFADVLAATATNSNTSVEIMGETFKNCASVAGALGYSIEDVSAAVGLMANAGVKGTIAGTALKNTFNGLLNGAKLSAEAFGEVEVSAVNADGTMKDFGDTMNELRGYFEQMTEAERVMNAMDIAGKYGYNGLLAIVNSTQQDFEKLTDSINECEGAASRMAEVKMDNLSGQVTLMNSAMDALKNTIGSAYDDELKELAKAATDVLTKINEFLAKHPVITKAIVGITAAVTALVGAFAAFATVSAAVNTIKRFAATTELATTAQKAFNLAAKANPYILIASAVAGAIVILEDFAASASNAREKAEGFANELQNIAENSKSAIDEQSQLERIVSEYERINSSVTDSKQKKEDLAELQRTLNDLYGDEKTGVDLVNGSYEEQIGLLTKLSEKEKAHLLNELENSKKESQKLISSLENQQTHIEFKYDIDSRADEEFAKALNEILSEENSFVNTITGEKQQQIEMFGEKGIINLTSTGDIDTQISTLEKLEDKILATGEANGRFADTFELIGERLKVLKEAKERADEIDVAYKKATGAEVELGDEAEDATVDLHALAAALAETDKNPDVLKERSEAVGDLVKNYGSLYDTLKDLQGGEAVSYEKIQALVKIYPELSGYIKVTADGYIVETGALGDLNDALGDSVQAQIEAEKGKTQAAIQGSKDRIKLYLKEMETYAKSGEMSKANQIKQAADAERATIAELEASIDSYDILPAYLASNKGKSTKSGSSGGKTAGRKDEQTKDPPGLKSLMSFAKTTSAAFKEMQDNGELALTTVQALIDAGYDEKVVYQDAAGKWQINADEYIKAANDQIDAAEGVDGTTEIQRQALEALRGELTKVTAGLYGVAKAEEEVEEKAEKLTLKDTESNMSLLSGAFAEQKENGGLSAKTIDSLSGTKFANAFDVTAEGTVRLRPRIVDSDLRKEIDKAVDDLNAELAKTNKPSEIKAINAKIAAYKQLANCIDDVKNGLYGVEKAEEKVLGDEAFKAESQQLKTRLANIDTELKAKQKLRDETLKAIDDEVQARKRLTEDNDIQRQIDQAMAQLNYSQLDEFSRAQLERKIRSLKNDKADMLWERGIEDRRAAVNKEYDSSAEELNAEKDAINNSLEVLRELNDQVAAGTAEIVSAIKEAIENQTPGKTPDITFNFADSLSADQIIKIVKDYYGE